MKELTLIIADDHELIRRGFREMLSAYNHMNIIDEAEDGEYALLKTLALKPDVLLLDINMPKMNGFEVLEKLKEINPNQRVLVLSIHNERDYVLEALDRGADGFISKASEIDVIIEGIETVAQGKSYVEDNLKELINKKSCLEELTKREEEILILISKGDTNKDISEKLSISEQTVKVHVANSFKKIKVNNRTNATLFVLKEMGANRRES